LGLTLTNVFEINLSGGKEHPNSGTLVWPVQLDEDTIETLLDLCPEFFDNFEEVEMDQMELGSPEAVNNASTARETQLPDSYSSDSYSEVASTSSSSGIETQQQPSPPNVSVDDSPLQPSMNRNKECELIILFP